MIIRQQQMDVFGDMADELFIKNLISHLYDEQADEVVELPYYSCLLDEVPEEFLVEMVRNGIERARSYGLTWESSIGDFVSLMFSVAPNFDQHPLINQELKNKDIPVDERVERLFEITDEETWDAATDDYDPNAWGVELPEEFEGISAGRLPYEPEEFDWE